MEPAGQFEASGERVYVMAKNLSTFAIAQMLQVDPGSVANWIDRKLLKAYRTPGGHRRVAVEDLLEFVREHKIPIPPELKDSPPCVLIVDDEPAVTKVIFQAVKTAHPEWEVIVAHDGFEAGSLVATYKPEIVVLDLRMPGIDGFEVCRKIKSQDATKHAEILAMTAYPSEENTDRILECGARACLEKPLDLEALIREMDTCLV